MAKCQWRGSGAPDRYHDKAELIGVRNGSQRAGLSRAYCYETPREEMHTAQAVGRTRSRKL